MEIKSMKNRTEFILWYKDWLEDKNETTEKTKNLTFTYHKIFIFEQCQEHKDIWWKDYVIWKLQQ